MKALVGPGGQMGIFYSARVTPDVAPDPATTPLGRSLEKWDLTYRTWDFTAAEREYWRRSLQVAGALRASFEAEGNHALCASRIRESQRALEAIEAGYTRRFFYHVVLDG